MHQLCVAETLGDYEEVLFDFKTNFEFLNEEFKLSMTLKIHVILEQYIDIFSVDWQNHEEHKRQIHRNCSFDI